MDVIDEYNSAVNINEPIDKIIILLKTSFLDTSPRVMEFLSSGSWSASQKVLYMNPAVIAVTNGNNIKSEFREFMNPLLIKIQKMGKTVIK